MPGALLERVGQRDEAGLGERPPQQLQPDREVVGCESGWHGNRRQPGVGAEAAVVPALRLTDDRRLLPHRRLRNMVLPQWEWDYF